MSHRILIYGASQGTGALIAERLLSAGYDVRAVVRSPQSATRLPRGVEVVHGDLTRPESLRGAARDVADIVVTAGVSRPPATASLVRTVEYEGVRAALEAAREDGFRGRFLYMTSLGVNRSSALTWLLNRVKGNTLSWRRQVEALVRESGLDYTIVRAGILLNAPSGTHPLEVTQGDRKLTFGTRVARSDVADLFVALIQAERPHRSTVEVIWGRHDSPMAWRTAIGALIDDPPVARAGSSRET